MSFIYLFPSTDHFSNQYICQGHLKMALKSAPVPGQSKMLPDNSGTVSASPKHLLLVVRSQAWDSHWCNYRAHTRDSTITNYGHFAALPAPTRMSKFHLGHFNLPECPQEPPSSQAAKMINNGQAPNTTKSPLCSAVTTGDSRLDSKPVRLEGAFHKSLFDSSPVKCLMPSPCLDSTLPW